MTFLPPWEGNSKGYISSRRKIVPNTKSEIQHVRMCKETSKYTAKPKDKLIVSSNNVKFMGLKR